MIGRNQIPSPLAPTPQGLTSVQTRQARIVELFFEALTLKKKEKLLSLCTEDIVLAPPVLALLPLASTISGKAAVDRYVEALRSSYKTFRLEVERIYSRPKGLLVNYLLCWTEPDGSWEWVGDALLFQFTGDYIRQIGFQGA
jgi:hypothetical protein